MKTNILRISILPLVLLITLSFTGLQQQKDKGNKNDNSQGKGNQNDKGNGNNNAGKSSSGNQNNGGGRSDNDQGKGGNGQSDKDNGNRGNQGNQKNKNNDNSRDRKSGPDDNIGMGKNNNGNGNGNDKGNGNGKFRRETIRWDRDENIIWGFDNYSSRKRPKDYKKVTICHNTGDSNYPVTITVSENALKAHLNHGDQVGNCTGNYSDRWPANFIRTRENVYNTYQTTWETMSYSEALLRFAADKLLGIKSTFQAQRPTLTSQEIQRREVLILDLQNNVNSLENQLIVTRQRTDGVNININL